MSSINDGIVGVSPLKIRKETRCIADNGMTEKVIRPGEHVTLVFHGGAYHSGEVSEITDRVITLSRNDGDYSYSISGIREIR